MPKTAGSKRAFVIPGKNGAGPRAIVTDACKTSRDWKGDVKRFAVGVYQRAPLEGALILELIFRLPRPKSHFRSGKNSHLLKENAPRYPAVKPDVLKMTRAVEDALTGILWRDDAQIVREVLEKTYANDVDTRIGVLITCDPCFHV